MSNTTPTQPTSLHNPYNMPGDLTLPAVHLNGSSVNDLIATYRRALDAVDAAMEALNLSAPNARNYYVVPGAFEVAREQFFAQKSALENARAYLQAHYYHCRKTAMASSRAGMETASSPA